MKCPIDQAEMEKAVGIVGYASFNIRLIKKPNGTFWKPAKSSPVDVYYCPKCGKVELTTEVKDESK